MRIYYIRKIQDIFILLCNKISDYYRLYLEKNTENLIILIRKYNRLNIISEIVIVYLIRILLS